VSDIREFDWHRDRITRGRLITETYRNTQNVRRFFKAYCGSSFKFDRSFIAWLKDGKRKTMGDAIDEWRKRNRARNQQLETALRTDVDDM
jgi:hypothetical protein